MAFTTLLIAVTLIVTFTDGSADPNFDRFPQVTIGYMPALPLHQPPQFPGYPQIRLPQPPPLPFIQFNNNQFPFKPMKPLEPLVPVYPFPSEETIANMDATDYTGLYTKVISSNGQGTAEMIMNNGGKFGFKSHKKPEFPSMKNTPFKFDSTPDFVFPSFQPIVIDPVIKPNFDNIRHRVPLPGEKFTYEAHNEESHFSNDNGAVKSKVKVAHLSNINGKVVEYVKVHETEP